MSSATSVLVRPYLRFLPKRRSAWLRRSYFDLPGSTMFRNSITLPLESGRPRLVSAIGTASTCPPRLWLVMLGKLLPGYGTLCHVPLSRTSILGMLYEASPLMFVFHPDSRWQKDCGHWPSDGLNCLKKSSVPPQPRPEMYICGCAA